jgi:hypothetical protein
MGNIWIYSDSSGFFIGRFDSLKDWNLPVLLRTWGIFGFIRILQVSSSENFPDLNYEGPLLPESSPWNQRLPHYFESASEIHIKNLTDYRE